MMYHNVYVLIQINSGRKIMLLLCLISGPFIHYIVRFFVLKSKFELGLKSNLIRFLLYFVVSNALSVFIIKVVLSDISDIFKMLSSDYIFALKYVLLSGIISALLTVSETILKSGIRIEVTSEYFNNLFARFKHFCISFNTNYLIYALALVCFFMHFVRIFNNTYWPDEARLISACRVSFTEMLKFVASEGHVPLYYIICWLFRRIFSESGILFHFISIIPYAILLILSVTLVRKKFGKITSAIFIVFISFLNHSIIYIMEIRMYIYCELFIFLAFIVSYYIFTNFNAGNKYFFLMYLFSAMAVYSHTYALPYVGIIYAVLLIYKICIKSKDYLKVFLSGTMILISYLPWLVYSYGIRGELISEYPIEQISLKNCLLYIFNSDFSELLFFIFIFAFTVCVLKITKIMNISARDNQYIITLNSNNFCISPYFVWMFSALLSVIITIFAAKLFSVSFYPIIVLRYFFPGLAMLWLVFGIAVSNLKLKRTVASIIIILVLLSGLPYYHTTVKNEIDMEKRLDYSLQSLNSIEDNDCIISDGFYYQYYIIDFYFPECERKFIWDTYVPPIDENCKNWLFLSAPITPYIEGELKKYNFSAELILENGCLGGGGDYYMLNVWVYDLKYLA